MPALGLGLLAAARRAIREEGGPMPTTAPMDELLDERLAQRTPLSGLRGGSSESTGDFGDREATVQVERR